MKIKYSDILNADEALSQIAKEKVTISEAVSVSRLIKAIQEEFEIFNQHQKDLLDKYGTVVDGNYKIEDGENLKKFNKDFSELLNCEVDIAIEPVKITSDIKINAETVMLGEKFIIFE